MKKVEPGGDGDEAPVSDEEGEAAMMVDEEGGRQQ